MIRSVHFNKQTSRVRHSADAGAGKNHCKRVDLLDSRGRLTSRVWTYQTRGNTQRMIYSILSTDDFLIRA